MKIHNSLGNGMRGSSVTRCRVDNSIVVDNSDDIATNDEAEPADCTTSRESSSVTNSLVPRGARSTRSTGR